MTTENELPNFETLADALVYYQKQGHDLDEGIRLAYRHRDLVSDWVKNMEALAANDE